MSGRFDSKVPAIGLFLICFIPICVHAQEIAPSTVLPSVVILTVQKSDGTTQTGNGFLTVRDGVVATALHLVRDAKSVVAKFSNGDEYECTGVIDKDDVRNVALIRIKVFGRPTLKMAADDLAAGAKLNLAAVRDSAFGILPVAVAEAASRDGTVWARLDGEIPLGNSGSPITDEAGNVVGLLTLKNIDEKVVGYLIPAVFILALDGSLPTQPWAQVSSAPAPQPAATPSASLDEIDALIGKSYVELSDNLIILEWAEAKIEGFGFKNGVPQEVYEFQMEMENIAGKLQGVRTDDPLRQRAIKALVQIIAIQYARTDSFIKSVVVGQQIGIWGAQSQDLFNRAAAMRKNIDVKLAEALTDISALETSSAKFREFMFPSIRYWLGLAPRPSGFRLGIVTYARHPFFLLVAYLDGFAYKIGFRPGDTIKSVAGRDFTKSYDIEQLKILIKDNLGQKIDAVVERDGKTENIKLKIPKEIPPEAIYK